MRCTTLHTPMFAFICSSAYIKGSTSVTNYAAKPPQNDQVGDRKWLTQAGFKTRESVVAKSSQLIDLLLHGIWSMVPRAYLNFGPWKKRGRNFLVICFRCSALSPSHHSKVQYLDRPWSDFHNQITWCARARCDHDAAFPRTVCKKYKYETAIKRKHEKVGMQTKENVFRLMESLNQTILQKQNH